MSAKAGLTEQLRKPNQKMIYISHSANQEIGTLKGLLDENGISIRDSFDVSTSSDLAETLHSNLKAAEGVIGIIDNGSSSVFFELGMAIALEKPLLLLLKPGSTPPFAISAMSLLTDLSDSETLRLAVNKFLAAIKLRRRKFNRVMKKPAGVRRLSTSMKPQPNRLGVDRAIRAANDLRGSVEQSVARVVGELLKAANVSAIQESREIGKGVDFAVWSDGLAPSMGNLVLIEVKAGKLTQDRIDTAYSDLARRVKGAEAGFGLLLYLDDLGRRFSKPRTWMPNIVAFDVEDFATELREKSFGRVIIERRNKIVHGLAD